MHRPLGHPRASQLRLYVPVGPLGTTILVSMACFPLGVGFGPFEGSTSLFGSCEFLHGLCDNAPVFC